MGGVHWHKKSDKWYTHLLLRTGKQKFGGTFKDELDAAKRINQMCKEMGIPAKNPGILGIPTQQYHKREKTSQYKGVYCAKSSGLWYASLYLNASKKIYGGVFKNELDAAKRINQICDEFKITPKNPGIKTYIVTNKDDKNQTSAKGAITVNWSGISKRDDENDDVAKKKKQKRKKDFISE